MKKTLIETMIFCGTLAGIVLLLGFTGTSNMQKPVKDLHVRVMCVGDQFFISPDRVRSLIEENMDSLEGQFIDQQMLLHLHELIQDIPWVDQASVYRTIDASVRIDITLHEPMMRIVNNKNEGFYVGVNGDLFPLSDEYTARVMLASGDIDLSHDETYHLQTAMKQDKAMEERLRGLYELATFISGDNFWRAFIDHIYLRKDGQFELMPTNGAHLIEFGHAKDIEKKFNKLKHFYTGGITQVGWHYYNRINIAYANQVICTK